ncbi:MAG: hypothetical protein WC928_03575 [Patescibacteria group bacterium]|jgi:hypothetical protein
MKIKKIFFIFSLVLFFIFSITSVVSLASTVTGETGTGSQVSGTTGSSVLSLKNPLKTDSVPALVGQIISAVLGIVGSLALIMFIYGGITWMTASGNEQSVTKGKNIIIWATLGLVVIFSSYALVRFVIQAIGA